MSERHVKVLIIGSGPAGYTAAIYAARANLSPVVVEGLQPGGQMTITTDVENYPGFADVVQGPWLMDQMRQQAINVGAEMVTDVVTEVDFSTYPRRAVTDSGAAFTADSVVIATGATARWLGLASEAKFQGAGVSACATCDGFFFRGEDVAVVGGGNTAAEEALFLANFANTVTLIHRRDQLRAEHVLQQRLFQHSKIRFAWNKVLDEVLGQESPAKAVTGVRLRDTATGALSELSVAGVFIAIGHDPATGVFRGQVPMDEAGYIATRGDSTIIDEVPGVFAAGDVKDRHYRQAVTAAGMGCMAALDAERYLGALEMSRTAAE